MRRALVDAYGAALVAFTKSPDEDARAAAYEIGRGAITNGLGVLDVTRLHALALDERLDDLIDPRLATQFLSEALAPFEMALRGVKESNTTLRRFNQTLEEKVAERTTALTARERELKRQTAVLRSVLDSMAEGVVVVTDRYEISLLNQAAAGIFGGGTGPGATRVPTLDAFEPDETTRIPIDRWPLARALRGETVAGEELYVRRGSVGVHLDMSASPLRDEESEGHGAVVVFRDTTRRREAEEAARKAEERLTRAQKLDAVGQLAGGVAHDFNNLLAVILSYCNLVLDDLDPESGASADVKQIQQAATSAATLTRQLLAFSRQQVLQPIPLDLNEVVTDLVRMLARTLGEHIDIETRLSPRPAVVLADRGQLEQVLMNLAVNARDAMPLGGKLTIETSETLIEIDGDETQSGRSSLAAGRYIVLAVSDTGVGMDEVTRARVFEPFFTTKERGRGTGLGLATVYGIAQQSGGTVAVYSEPGHGTTFRVCLPVSTRAVSARGAPMSNASRGHETILLVEDDDRVRTVAERVLKKAGYHVLVAARASEARELCASHHGPIELVLTDVVMPGETGPAVARDLLAQRPDMKVLFTSGYAAGSSSHAQRVPLGAEFLEKPFTADGLRRKVRDVLDGSRT